MKNLLCITLIFIGLGAKAQVEPNPVNSKLRELAVSLDSFSNKVPIEKVHIQFDKPFYSLGDTIWMKAYVVNESNGLSALSKVLYADLINDKDQVKISLRLPLTNGLGWGAITLNDSLLHEGNYHIRAYTNLMRNFGPEYFFDKAIYIGDALSQTTGPLSIQKGNTDAGKKSIKTIPDSTGIRMQFFPEGGELVNNLVSKVAFKAMAANGLGQEISGYVVDKDNRQITTFRSEYAGMGTFVLRPAPGNTYTAVVKFADSTEKRFKLSGALDKGYVLSVTQRNDNVIVSVQVSSSLLNSGEISLIAQSNNIVLYTGKKELTRTGYTAIIPGNRFPEGITQFTLFSPQYQPVAERLVFIRHANQHLNVNIVPDKPGYKQRDKVRLSLEVTDQDGKPVTAAFSMAITDEGQVPYTEADEKTIFSNLLLTSDLKGYIERPNYYFTDITPDKDRQLDNLLLTQGWRRFVWKDIITNTLPNLAYQPELGSGISGRILTAKGSPAARAKVTMLLNIGEGLVVDTITNAEGRFNFNKLPFRKGMGFNVYAVDAKGKKNVRIEIDKKNTAPPAVDHLAEQTAYNYQPEEQPVNTAFTTYIDSTRKRYNELNKNKRPNAVNLKEVVIQEKKIDKVKQIALQDSKNMAGPASTDYVFTFVDLAKAPTVGLFLLTHVLGAGIKVDRFGNWGSGDLTVIVDGYIREFDYYNSIPLERIAGIEVLKNSSINNGAEGARGSVIITLKRPGVDYQKYIDEHDEEQHKALAQKKEEKQKAIALKEVTIREKKEDKVKEIAFQYSDSRAGKGGADQELTFVDLADCIRLGNCLATKLTGVRVITDVHGNWSAKYEEGSMIVVVDGQVRGPDYYNIISPGEISGIEVIKGARAGNLYGGNITGAIIITTKKGGVDYNKYIDEHNEEIAKTVQLNEVEVIAKKMGAASVKELAVKHSQNLAGPGNADQVLTFIDLLPCQSDLSKCLDGRLVGIFVKDGKAYSRGGDSPMHVIVDGVERDLSDVVSNDVSSVEVLRGGGAASLYGMHGGGGVLIVTTKKGDVDYNAFAMEHYRPGYTKPPGLVTYKVQDGYDLRRQFYSPDYDNPAMDKQVADLRSTIYWNPNIISDGSGKATIEFFNADGKGNYRVITEGVDGEGKLGRQVARYTVK